MNGEEPSIRVVEAVAREAGEPPETMSPPLYDVIDPDALDDLITNCSTELTVAFEYNGYEVEVSGEGSISVAPSDSI